MLPVAGTPWLRRTPAIQGIPEQGALCWGGTGTAALLSLMAPSLSSCISLPDLALPTAVPGSALAAEGPSFAKTSNRKMGSRTECPGIRGHLKHWTAEISEESGQKLTAHFTIR